MSLRKQKLIEIVPEKCLKYASVKWSKGDSLDKIAKHFGLKDGKTIWNHSSNKGVVRKRKKPESIEPGDELFIPPSAADEKELRKEIDTWNRTKRATVDMANVLEGQIKDIEGYIEEYYKTVDKLNRQKFDAKDNQAKVVLAAVEAIRKGLNVVALAKSGIAPGLKLDAVTKISSALKSHSAKMAGDLANSNVVKTQLELMRTIIESARKEISEIEARIAKLDEELDKSGARTIYALCNRSATLELWGDGILRQMNSP